MTPSFFALLTKAGIACAADTDHSFYPLSKGLPVAIAVNPNSPIPWDSIIKRYQEKLAPAPQCFFESYASDFDIYLSSIQAEPSWKDLSPEETEIIFLGYGADDIFPSLYGVNVMVDETGVLGLSNAQTQTVTNHEPVLIEFLGDFESVSPVLFGASTKMREFFCNRYRPVWKGFVERVSEQVREEPFGNSVISFLEARDDAEEIGGRVDSATERLYNELMMGIDTFSVGDLVAAVEAIVNANARLGHLKSGAAGQMGETREIAVITIPEGVSWIMQNKTIRGIEA